MALSHWRCGALFFPVLAFAFGLLAAALPAAAADINVVLDQAKLIKLPGRVATVIIGNPSIADATVQSGGTMIITGKGYGMTNIVALDHDGAVLLSRSVAVTGPRADVVVVYRGVERETYSCTPYCERRLTLGDSGPYFDQTAAQIAARNAVAQGGAAPSK
jgi:Pilus formation protein N terminal region